MTRLNDDNANEQNLQEFYARPKVSYWGWLIVVLGFCGFLLWAALAPLDNGVAVPGTLMVSGHRQAVETLSSGVVKQLLVKEGDIVSKDQILIELDPTAVQSQRNSLNIQQLSLQVKIARLKAEQARKGEVTFSNDISASSDHEVMAAIALQEQLFHSRKATLSSELESIHANIQGQQAVLLGLKDAASQKRIQSESLREQLANIRKLSEDGYVAKHRLFELERQYAQLHAEIARDQGVVGQTLRQISELQSKYQQRQQVFAQDVADDLAASQLQLQETSYRLNSANFELNQYQIKAPSNGVVVGLNVHTVGGVVGAGHRLMEIVPEHMPLIITGQLPVNQIDRVQTGLPVELLFTAFNQSQTPRLDGQVSLVAPDRLLDEKTGMPYYPLQVSVEPRQLKRLKAQALVAGMPVEIFIKTGERSLLNYLFKPLIDRSRTSWGDS